QVIQCLRGFFSLFNCQTPAMKEYPAFSVILFLSFIICFIIVPEWKNGKGFEKTLAKICIL
ncbi:hypothetical protein L0P49_11080, partial [Enterocloster bolteae]|uniref:hypothetical protein n=1 Tax=Enterocloster bolteae TaxID=208479 RepID=UPI001EDE7BE8